MNCTILLFEACYQILFIQNNYKKQTNTIYLDIKQKKRIMQNSWLFMLIWKGRLNTNVFEDVIYKDQS